MVWMPLMVVKRLCLIKRKHKHRNVAKQSDCYGTVRCSSCVSCGSRRCLCVCGFLIFSIRSCLLTGRFFSSWFTSFLETRRRRRGEKEVGHSLRRLVIMSCWSTCFSRPKRLALLPFPGACHQKLSAQFQAFDQVRIARDGIFLFWRQICCAFRFYVSVAKPRMKFHQFSGNKFSLDWTAFPRFSRIMTLRI